MHPHHHGSTFLVPRRGEAPDVGVVSLDYVEPLQDEVAEIACAHARGFPESLHNQRRLVAYGMEIVALLKRRAEADVPDFGRPLRLDSPRFTPAQAHKLVAAHMGRMLDWVCKGKRVSDMGPRIFAFASHVRASAVDHRTDQQAALEIGNHSRASIYKVRSEFRRDLGADYPGENGKTTHTKEKCKTSRLKQLKR